MLRLERRHDVASVGAWCLRVLGSRSLADQIAQQLRHENPVDGESLCDRLHQLVEALGEVGTIVATNDEQLVILSDPVRAVPIFWRIVRDGVEVTDTPAFRREEDRLDDGGVIEYWNSGFCSGDMTLIAGLKQLTAGETLVIDLATLSARSRRRQILAERWQRGASPPRQSDALEAIDRSVTAAVRAAIDEADGSQIVLFLSGGLDSRLLAAKLHELEAPNVLTVSYGPSGNAEARTAERVAKHLGFPWLHIRRGPFVHRGSDSSKVLESALRAGFDFATVPTIAAAEALNLLCQRGVIDGGCILMNGQSGDFIAGGHRPRVPPDESGGSRRERVDFFVDFVVGKHFSLWSTRPSGHDSHIRSIVRGRANELLDQCSDTATAIEQWELEERQSKLVLSDLRIVEDSGFRWSIPLWDPRVVRAFSDLGAEERRNQQAYRAYLRHYDYSGVFSRFSHRDRSWRPALRLATLPFRHLPLLRGRLGVSAYKHLMYFGHYADKYRLFGWRDFRQHVRRLQIPPPGRGIVALSVVRSLELLELEPLDRFISQQVGLGES